MFFQVTFPIISHDTSSMALQANAGEERGERGRREVMALGVGD